MINVLQRKNGTQSSLKFILLAFYKQMFKLVYMKTGDPNVVKQPVTVATKSRLRFGEIKYQLRNSIYKLFAEY